MAPPNQLASSALSSASPAPSEPAQVDDLLILLNTYLEQVSSEIPTLQHRISRLAEGPTEPDVIEDVRDRWDELQVEWEDVVSEVELLKEELKEDTWLTIFR